jgi:hypothetical protein
MPLTHVELKFRHLFTTWKKSAYIHVCTRTLLVLWMYVCYMYTCAFVICMFVCQYLASYTCVCMYVYIYIYIDTHTNTHIPHFCADVIIGKCGKFEERQVGDERYNIFLDCPGTHYKHSCVYVNIYVVCKWVMVGDEQYNILLDCPGTHLCVYIRKHLCVHVNIYMGM